jgi:transcription elongation GreA/GreB family factor
VQATELTANTPERFSLLGAWDSEPEKGIVSYLSPVAQSLLGHKPGDEVEVEVNGVHHHYRLDSIQAYKTA